MDLWTIGQVAEYFRCPAHKIRYVLESRSIQPTGRIRRTRVFDQTARDRIGKALREIEVRKGTEAVGSR
jgi:DNA-binding transcriptional MerR regulator